MFEIKFDPRLLTATERACVARMLTDWGRTAPDDLAPPALPDVPDSNVWRPQRPAPEPTFNGKTETQLLDDEQAADLAEHREHQDNSDPAAAAAAFAGDVPDRDADGLPWDRRIHSGSKARNADGTWRKMRGVDPALVASVTAELRALVDAPVVAQVPPPPAVQVSPPPPIVTAAVEQVTLETLLYEVGQAIMHKVISSAELAEVCGKHGVANVGLLVSRKDLVPQVAADFRALVASKGQPQ